MVSCCCGG